MQLHSRTFPPSPSAKEAIPYSSEAMRHDLQRVRDAWADCQATRDRNAIYAYLSAVYGLVAVWAAEGREVDRARSGRPVLRRHSVHRRPGQGRQTDPEQVVSGAAVRGDVQAGFRAAGPVHSGQGRHQRLRCSVRPVLWCRNWP
jgi:hypothetical protein